MTEHDPQVAKFVGERIALARRAAGLSQSDLGHALGLTGDTAKMSISKMERGEVLCSMTRLFRISQALGLRACELLDETTEFASPP